MRFLKLLLELEEMFAYIFHGLICCLCAEYGKRCKKKMLQSCSKLWLQQFRLSVDWAKLVLLITYALLISVNWLALSYFLSVLRIGALSHRFFFLIVAWNCYIVVPAVRQAPDHSLLSRPKPHTHTKTKRHLLYLCLPVWRNQLYHFAAIMKYKVLAPFGHPYSRLHSSSVGVQSLKCSICLFFFLTFTGITLVSFLNEHVFYLVVCCLNQWWYIRLQI